MKLYKAITPLEQMAGNDIVWIRQSYSKFKMLGGFNKTVMHLGPGAMREEFERLLPVMKQV